ncbi:hypothetical protein YC2023_019866 [Brassica napus]
MVCCFGQRRKCDVVKNPKLIKGISDHNSRPDQPSSHFPFLFSFMHCCHLNLVNSIKKYLPFIS